MAQRNFKIKNVGTNDMLADVLTKPVPEGNDEQSTSGYELPFLRRTASIITQEIRWLESGYYFLEKIN